MGPQFFIVGESYVDYFCFLAGRLPRAGEDSVLQQPLQRFPGGSPINTATHLQALQQQQRQNNHNHNPSPVIVLSVFNTEDGDGKLLQQHANAHKFRLVNCHADDGGVTPHCVIVVTGEDRTFMTHRGCAASWSTSDLSPSLSLEKPCHVHVAGFYCTPGFGENQSLCASIKEWKKEYSATISLVTQYDVTEKWDGGLVEEVIPLLDILIMNEQEATSVMNKKTTTLSIEELDEEDQLISTWLSFYTQANVVFVVTMGAKGAVAFCNQKIVSRQRVTAAGVSVVDPTGAGDAFAAGFLHGFYNINPVGDIDRALKWGCCVGSAAVAVRGASVNVSDALLQEFLLSVEADSSSSSESSPL